MHIGPEPTTDKFIAVVNGETGKVIKGNALIAVGELPFAGLHVCFIYLKIKFVQFEFIYNYIMLKQHFGDGFLNKFEAAVVSSPFLKDVNIVDTPGIKITNE